MRSKSGALALKKMLGPELWVRGNRKINNKPGLWPVFYPVVDQCLSTMGNGLQYPVFCAKLPGGNMCIANGRAIPDDGRVKSCLPRQSKLC